MGRVPCKAFLKRNWDRLLVAGVWLLSFAGVPLTAMQGDGGWYYMVVHYLRTGTYHHAVGGPFFQGPVLYHNPLGYPLLIALAQAISAITRGLANWPLCLQLMQGAAYFGSYEVCRRLFRLLSGGRTSRLLPLAYVLYFPNLEFSHYVLSECIAGFWIALFSLSCVSRALDKDDAAAWPGLLAALSGALAVFTKPVFLPFVLLLAVLFAIAPHRRRADVAGLALLLALLLTSMIFNRVFFGRLALKNCWGWNIYNRVANYDGRLNAEGPATSAVSDIVGRPIPDEWYWWDLTQELSAKGFNPHETALLAKAMSLEGIRTYPAGFTLGTLRNALSVFFGMDPCTQVHPDAGSYRRSQEELNRGQDAYLVSQLLKHWPDRLEKTGILTRDYHRFMKLHFAFLGLALVNPVWGVIYLFGLRRLPRPGLRATRRFALWLVSALPLFVILLSAASEHTFPRYKVPVMPLVFVYVLLELHRLAPAANRLFSRVRPRAPDAAS